MTKPEGILGRRQFLAMGASAAARAMAATPIPARTVVLTFDDAVKSHRTFVAPLLKDLGFRATFFVTHLWMNDQANFMTWKEIAEIHDMGFEIGNHAWTHADYSTPRNASRLAGELALTDYKLHEVGVPRPVSFAYCGNNFGPEAIQVVRNHGFEFSRRGLPPEAKYGSLEVGAAFEPAKHHPLLVPSTGDAYPNWTMEQFQRVVAEAREGRVAVMQFHGVPDVAHPWVHTPPENFERYMEYLKRNGFTVLALHDLARFVNPSAPPDDPVLKMRYPAPKNGRLVWPVEVEATRADLAYWLRNMLADHRYSISEAAAVCALPEPELKAQIAALHLPSDPVPSGVRVLPYPGGRHPRIGFREGAIDPLRGTKASVFLPWKDGGYVVVDLPEAIFAGKELVFLAHTHIPTIWNEKNVVIENTDWQRMPEGGLRSRWTLPDGVSFGASIAAVVNIPAPAPDPALEMELWIENKSQRDLTQIRSQICVTLAGAPEFRAQTASNKELQKPRAAVRSGTHWIATEWEQCGRVWGNPLCPCMHSDPILPDCPIGATVRVRGRLWFHDGVSLAG
jgi:peptidoglycan/xylan/chitin deacetylase (PgdA/CDA1 family)